MDLNKVLLEISTQVEKFFPQLLAATFILGVGWWLSGKLTKIIGKALTRAKVDLGIISFSKSILKCTFRIIVILAALATANVNVTSLIAALSAAFVTVGIALKDSLSNIASGVIIIINKPFKVGDYLEVDSLCGTVVKIELIFTTLLSPENKVIVIPNSKMANYNIVNCNKKPSRRIELSYSVKNSIGVEKIKAIFKDIISTNSKVLTEPAYEISINEYSADKTEFKIKLWCKTKDYNQVKNEINEQVKIKLDREFSTEK